MQALLRDSVDRVPEVGRGPFPGDEPRIQIRPLLPSDATAMRAALERLSPDSRYRRFMSCKATFTDQEVAQLTDADGIDHVALCALLERPNSSPEIIGAARYFRLGDPERTAEPAIMVVDDYQGAGLGSALFRQLLGVAAEHGIRRFQCELLTSNVPMKRLIDQVSGGSATYTQGEPGSLVAKIPLPGAA